MAADEIHPIFAPEGGFTITQTEENAIQEQVNHLLGRANTLRQLLDDCRRQAVSSSQGHAQTRTTITHPVAGLTAPGDSERHFRLEQVYISI